MRGGDASRRGQRVLKVREGLLEAAVALFQETGYVHASIRDIVSVVGVPKGTFYNYFASKEALASAVVAQQRNALLGQLVTSDLGDAEAVLRVHLADLIDAMAGGRRVPLTLLTTLAAEAPALPAAIGAQVAFALDAWSERMSALVLASMKSRTPANASLAAAIGCLLTNCLQGACLRSKCGAATHPAMSIRLVLDQLLGLRVPEKL